MAFIFTPVLQNGANVYKLTDSFRIYACRLTTIVFFPPVRMSDQADEVGGLQTEYITEKINPLSLFFGALGGL